MTTQISLPQELEDQIAQIAKARGMEVSDFVRSSLEKAVAEQTQLDPLLGDSAVYEGDVPVDLSLNHDEHLYGE